MTNEENYMNSRVKRENPFRVPDGYFDQLAERVMASLPEETVTPMIGQMESDKSGQQSSVKGRVATVRRLRPWMWAAACFTGIIMLGTVYFTTMPDNQAEQTVASASFSESYIDEACDYAMLDNQDIYACLAGDF